jgi:hypothetical protein
LKVNRGKKKRKGAATEPTMAKRMVGPNPQYHATTKRVGKSVI